MAGTAEGYNRRPGLRAGKWQPRCELNDAHAARQHLPRPPRIGSHLKLNFDSETRLSAPFDEIARPLRCLIPGQLASCRISHDESDFLFRNIWRASPCNNARRAIPSILTI
jgi:hypothetical protein